jgi:hypothetical protein
MGWHDRLRAAAPRVKLTYDDFLLFPEDGERHELIDGEHSVTPSPNTKHQAVSGNLYFLVRSWLKDHPVGRIFYAPFDVVFTQFDVVEPDLLYMSSERAAEILTSKHVTGSPDRIRVHRSHEGRFGRAEEFLVEAGDVLTSRHLPGLEMPLTAVFAG